MLVIFPFEERFYRERGVNAQFVGHPLAEAPPPPMAREDYAAKLGLDPTKTFGAAASMEAAGRKLHGNLPARSTRTRAHERPAGLSLCQGNTFEQDVRHPPTSPLSTQYGNILPVASTIEVEDLLPLPRRTQPRQPQWLRSRSANVRSALDPGPRTPGREARCTPAPRS